MGILYDDVVIIRPPEKEDDPTMITVNCPDKTGLGCDLCRIILFFGLNIVRGGNFTNTKNQIFHSFWDENSFKNQIFILNFSFSFEFERWVCEFTEFLRWVCFGFCVCLTLKWISWIWDLEWITIFCFVLFSVLRWRRVNWWKMVLHSFLGGWETEDKVEFVEEEDGWSMSFLFLSFWNLLLLFWFAAN